MYIVKLEIGMLMPHARSLSFILLLLLLTMAGLCSPPQVRADDVSICYESWEPYSYLDGNQHIGIKVDLATEALARMGRSVSFIETAYNRCVVGVERGRYDGMLLTSDESSLIRGDMVTVYWMLGFYAHQESSLSQFTALTDFADLRVGLVQGYEYPEEIVSYDGWIVDMISDADLNVPKLTHRRIDLVFDDVVWLEGLRQQGAPIRLLEPVFAAVPQRTYFSPQRAALMRAFDRELAGLIADGTVDRVYERYIGAPFSEIQSAATQARVAVW